MRSHFESTQPSSWNLERRLFNQRKPDWRSITALAAVTILPTWIILTSLTTDPFRALPAAILMQIFLFSTSRNGPSQVEDFVNKDTATITFVPFQSLVNTLLTLSLFLVFGAACVTGLWLGVLPDEDMTVRSFLEYSGDFGGILAMAAALFSVIYLTGRISKSKE